MPFKKDVLTFFFALSFGSLFGQAVDLSTAGIMASETIKNPVRNTIIRVLQEETAKRTGIDLPLAETQKGHPLIVLASIKDKMVNGLAVPHRSGNDLPEEKAEGYRLVSDQVNGKAVLWFIGADERGVLFATGEFLRNADLEKGKILFDTKDEIATSPAYPIRGHQLGYRNTANSWDAWSVDQFETYIRELALFGTNAIENIPFQDGGQSPVMTVPREVMNIEMSRICENYGLDYWVWTPSDADLSDPKQVEKEVEMHTEFYKKVPKLDGVFFPGGDPGHNDPKYVMPFLEKIAAQLHKYHPAAGMWISLQGFSDQQVDYFYAYLEKFSPDWLKGVVTGPSSPGVAETRFRLPKKYEHRFYPDITHTVRCDFPVKNWDQAFALTEGREVSNPQPFYYHQIFERLMPFTDGFISYSDGVHDDVNKVLFSELAWDPRKKVRKILEEYSRFFFGNDLARAGAEGILALEKNWEGPVEQNPGIEMTFQYFNQLDKKHPELKDNWRWQLLNLRSYYDTYTARRKMYEKGLEAEADSVMAKARETGVAEAMKKALEIVNEGDTKPVNQDLRQRIVAYCQELWESIGLQTSVEKYHAKNPERGAILDFLDYPLNNRWWLQDEFEKIAKMKTDQEKIDRLTLLAHWGNPGKGSYYDNVSDVSNSPHVKTTVYDATDVAWWDHGYSRKRLSTQLFQNFPKLVYEDLDPEGDYVVRISGYGDALLRVNGHRIDPFEYNKGLEQFKAFRVGRKYVATGKLVLTFDEPEESKLNWRDHSKVSDVWLLKQKAPMTEDYTSSSVKQPNYGIN